MRRLFLLGLLVIPGLATAQRGTAAPYVRYATAITTKADSVVGFLNRQVGNLTNDAALSTLAQGAARMKRLTAEFAAVDPPQDFAGLHRELVDALQLVTRKADHAATLMQTALNTSNSDEQRTSAAETAQHELSDLQSGLQSCEEVRQRAETALAAHGATLPAARR